MATKITNLLDVNFTVPEPIGAVLLPRQEVTYPNVAYQDLINDVRFDEMVLKRQILIENADPAYRPVPEATTAAMDIYVATTGSDDNLGTSSSLAYRTLDAALAAVPATVLHRVHIRVAAGTYTSFPDVVSHSIKGDGQLTIEAIGTPATEAGPFAITTYTDPANTYSSFVVTGAGWTADEFYGKWVMMTSGAADGHRFPIFKNTTDTIITVVGHSWDVGAIGATDTFVIVDPEVTVNIDHGVVFEQTSGAVGAVRTSSGKEDFARLGCSGILFNTTATYTVNPWEIYGGNSNFIHCTFKVPLGPSGFTHYYALRIDSCELNRSAMSDPLGFDNALTLGTTDTGIQCQYGDALPTTVSGANPYFGTLQRSSEISGLCSRAHHVVVGEREQLEQGCVAALLIYELCRFVGNNIYIDAVGLGNRDAVQINTQARVRISYSYIEEAGTAKNAFGVDRGAVLDMYAVTGNAANIALYGVSVAEGGLVVRDTSTTVAGTTNDTYFVNNTTAAAWPAGSINDTAGAFITTR